jgi:hypothetical protein
MRARILIGAAATGSMVLVLVVMCVVVAQNPPSTRSRSKSAEAPNQIPRLVPDPTLTVPLAPSGAQVPVVPAPPGGIAPATEDSQAIYSATPTSPQPGRLAVIELNCGFKLTGKLAAGPIPFHVMFGQASLPLETIRGIRIADQVRSDVGPPQLISATIILENGDSLTGMPRLDVIQLQTEWGEAVVKLTHLKSIVLTGDNVVWEQHDGRWRLVPAPQTQPDSQPAQRDDAARPPPIDSAAELSPAPLNPATLPAAPMVPASDSLR